MALSPIQVGQILGLSVQGDLGPFTIYTQLKAGKRSLVIFPKIWLSDPSSIRQRNHRNRIRGAARLWRDLPANDKRDWQRVSNKLSLKQNGFALWIWWRLKGVDSTLATLERQSGITLNRGPTR